MSERDEQFREDVRAFMASTGEVIVRMDKILTAHSNEIWGTSDIDPGLKRKIDGLVKTNSDQNDTRIWWRGAIGVPVIGLAIDWALRHWPKT